MWRLAEPDIKMLQGEHGKDSVLLAHRLCLHAVCGRSQESTTRLDLNTLFDFIPLLLWIFIDHFKPSLSSHRIRWAQAVNVDRILADYSSLSVYPKKCHTHADVNSKDTLVCCSSWDQSNYINATAKFIFKCLLFSFKWSKTQQISRTFADWEPD